MLLSSKSTPRVVWSVCKKPMRKASAFKKDGAEASPRGNSGWFPAPHLSSPKGLELGRSAESDSLSNGIHSNKPSRYLVALPIRQLPRDSPAKACAPLFDAGHNALLVDLKFQCHLRVFGNEEALARGIHHE
jgi:hypothetical protein